MTHKMNSKLARNDRQLDAKDAQSARDQRTPEAQLKMLDFRLSEGVGAKRERARLQRQINAAQKRQVMKDRRKAQAQS